MAKAIHFTFVPFPEISGYTPTYVTGHEESSATEAPLKCG